MDRSQEEELSHHQEKEGRGKTEANTVEWSRTGLKLTHDEYAVKNVNVQVIS